MSVYRNSFNISKNHKANPRLVTTPPSQLYKLYEAMKMSSCGTYQDYTVFTNIADCRGEFCLLPYLLADFADTLPWLVNLDRLS